MKVETVIEIAKLLQSHDIDVVVDGGWGVDALLGEQTRPHEDLDIAIPHKDVTKLRQILTVKGYAEIFRDDSRDCNFVLQDDLGLRAGVTNRKSHNCSTNNRWSRAGSANAPRWADETPARCS